jgi:hypothetical protein
MHIKHLLSDPALGLIGGPVDTKVMEPVSLLVDERLTPLPGLSAPNRASSLVTHLRDFIAHLVYDLSVAGGNEGIAWNGTL